MLPKVCLTLCETKAASSNTNPGLCPLSLMLPKVCLTLCETKAASSSCRPLPRETKSFSSSAVIEVPEADEVFVTADLPLATLTIVGLQCRWDAARESGSKDGEERASSTTDHLHLTLGGVQLEDVSPSSRCRQATPSLPTHISCCTVLSLEDVSLSSRFRLVIPRHRHAALHRPCH